MPVMAKKKAALPGKGIGAKVKGLREGKGWSQQQLAAESGLSISVVARIEQGNAEDPRTSTLIALAAALGVAVDKLLG